jgi:ADP-ribose pyrophosphatase YjhB (NUDIX family)
MKFNNRQNERVELKDGRVAWLSRSVAMVSIVVLELPDGGSHILMNKRGPGCPDEVGKWVLPCGYLDWDESCVEGARREIWEETGVDVTSFYETSLYNDFTREQPFFVRDKPKSDGKQNVSQYYAIISKVDELPEVTAQHCEHEEVDEIRWVPLQDFDTLEIGFSHRDIVHYFFDNVYQH